MSYPFDTVSAGIVAAINGRKDGTLTSTQAAELLEPLLETIAPSQLSQLNSVIQVLGRAKGLFFTNGVPANTLGAIGSSAIDLENHMFYGPKTSLGWPAGIQFVGDTGAPGESYADIARNLGNVFGVPVDEDSTDAEVLIAVAQAAANLVTPGFNSILVELHGAIPNNPAIDNAAAINAAETAAALVGATVEFRAGATYYFKSQIGGNRNGLTWVGKNTSLVYNGASTTIDLVKFGNDSTEKTGMLVQGLSIRSLTTMTAGAAVRTPLVCRSRFEFINIQGQDYRETNGNKLYNGIYADRVDNVHFSGTDIVAQNNGFMLRGATGVGPKADCWVDFRKICYCTVGFLMGGAFGGVYIGVNDYIVNGTDVLANQSLQAEQNRELFINGGIFDGATNASSASIVLDDPGALLVQINGSWIASGLGHGVWIKQSTGKIILSSPRIWNFAKDGIRNDVGSSAVISISDAQIHDNGAWGVNPTVSGHHTTVADSRLFSNVSGNINTTYAPASRAITNYADITNLTSKYVLSDQLFVDALYGSYLSGGNPYLSYDSNDYSVYDRSVNRYAIFVNGGQVFSASAAGVNIGPGNDALLTRGGAGVIDQRNGTNAQSFRIYNTYTDASNYERGVVGWNSNNFDVNTAQAGTGTSRNLRLYTTGAGEVQLGVASSIQWKIATGGHWLANADAAYNIGAVGASRPNNIYAAGVGVFGGALTAGGTIQTAAGSSFYWANRSTMYSPSDGVILLANSAGSDFNRIQGGGTTNAFPSWKRSGAGWDARLADDSGLTFIGASSVVFNGQATVTADGSHILALRSGANAQSFRVYNTYTDGSNYERGGVFWNSNNFDIKTELAGTGAARSIRLFTAGAASLQFGTSNNINWVISSSGHFLANVDNTYDIGASGANRPRSLYLGTSLNAGTNIAAGGFVQAGGGVYAGATAGIYLNNRSGFTSPADGQLLVRDWDNTGAIRVQFGGTSNLFPSWKRNADGFHARLADDSGFTWVRAAYFWLTNGSYINDIADGVISLRNGTGAAATRLLFGTGSGNPSLKNNGARLDVRLADDSAYAGLAASKLFLAGDVHLERDAADILAQRNGVNAQAFRLYRTYTDASNYERFEITTGSTYFQLGVSVAGTGSAKDLRVGVWSYLSTGHFVAQTDNTYDIGASGANRPRNIYAGSNVIAGGIVQVSGTSAFAFGGRSVITSPADGVLAMSNNARTDFGRLQFGGTTSSFPALKRNGTALDVRLADDSAYAGLTAASFFSAGSIRVTNDSGVFSLGTSSDAILARDAANTLALRNGTNAQALCIYGTYTDASNYGRLRFTLSGSTWNIQTEAAGTGTATSLALLSGGNVTFGSGGSAGQWRISTGHFVAVTDNAYDIGASGATRPRSIYVGTDVVAGGKVQATGDVLAGATSDIQLSGRFRMRANADGSLGFFNTAANGFTRLAFGGFTSNEPAWKRGADGFHARLADDSAFTWVRASYFWLTNGSYINDIADGTLTLRNSSGGAATSLQWGSDTVLARDAADTLAMRRGANAQVFRLYNTYTDASNYERGGVFWNSNNFDITIEKLGTGLSRNLRIYNGSGSGELHLGTDGWIQWRIASGHLLANIDNAHDIGASGANRVRSIYAGSNVIAGGIVQTGGTSAFAFGGRSVITSPADGVLAMSNNASTDFGRLIGGPSASASYPAWKRSGASWEARLGDDTGYAVIYGASLGLYAGGASVSFGTAQDLTIIRDAADTLAQRRGVNAQSFRVYNTYTDGSNFERASLSWGSNVFSIRTGGAGTGTQRAFTVDGSTFTVATGGTDRWTANGSGHLLAATDNTYDIGASGATRPRTIYAGTSIIVPTPAVADSSTKVATTAFVTNLTTTGRNRVFVEDYGAVAGNSSIDNASAINAAETAAAAIGAEVCFKSNASYYFKSVIGGARNGLMWAGLNTSLIYNGASTTLADMVLFGDGTNSYYDMKVEGFIIRSLTNMTAGNAMRTPLVCRSTFDVGIQGQDFYQANGNYIYNGIYADRIDNVRYNGLDCIAKNKGFTIRGATSTGPKAGCWMNINKIALCALAIHVGGAFGGIMIGATDLIQNGINLRVDQGLQAEENREIFCNGTIFDVTTNASEASIVLNDAGNTFIDIRNAWVASSAGHGVWIKQGTGKIMFSAVRIFNNAGDGFRSDVGVGTLVNIVGGQIHNNGGYGINPTNASGNYIRIGDTISFASNTSGAVNETYLNSAGPATLSQRYFGVANGSGVLTIAHGDSALPNKLLNVTAFYEHATGVSIPLTMNYIDGTNLVFNANASAASKNCRVLVTSQTAAKWS